MSIKIAIHTTRRREKYDRIVSIIKEQLSRPEEVEFLHTPYPSDVSKIAEELDILVCYTIPREAFEKAQNLSWIHIGTAGIEHTLFPELRQRNVLITNASGIHAKPASEFVMAQVLYFAKDFEEFRVFKESHRWTQWELAARITILCGKTIGIVGLGSIGHQIAKKAKAFDMRVMATKYFVKPEDQFAEVDMLLPKNKLSKLLRESDYVILTIPLTEETRHLLDRNHIYQMKSTAYLINISRGKVVDEEALIDALQSQKIAGAALDVFEEEPLSQDSPLFDLKNVLLSPHISGNFPEYVEWASEDFGENLNRYLTGKRLRNIVNVERGY